MCGTLTYTKGDRAPPPPEGVREAREKQMCICVTVCERALRVIIFDVCGKKLLARVIALLVYFRILFSLNPPLIPLPYSSHMLLA